MGGGVTEQMLEPSLCGREKSKYPHGMLTLSISESVPEFQSQSSYLHCKHLKGVTSVIYS